MEEKNEKKKFISVYNYERYHLPDLYDYLSPQFVDFQLDRKFKVTYVFTEGWTKLGVYSNFYIYFMAGLFKGVILPQPSLLFFGTIENLKNLNTSAGLFKLSSDVIRRSLVFGHWYGIYNGMNETLYMRTHLDSSTRYLISGITATSVCGLIFTKPKYLFSPAHFLLLGSALLRSVLTVVYTPTNGNDIAVPSIIPEYNVVKNILLIPIAFNVIAHTNSIGSSIIIS